MTEDSRLVEEAIITFDMMQQKHQKIKKPEAIVRQEKNPEDKGYDKRKNLSLTSSLSR